MSFNKLKELELKLEELEQRALEPKAKTLTKEDNKNLYKRAAEFYLVKQITGKEDVRGFDDVKTAIRAINPSDVQSWLEEQFTQDLVERMSLLGGLESMFPAYTIPTNVSSLSIPKKKSGLKAYLIAPSQDAINSALQAAKVTFQAKRLVTLSTISDQAIDEAVLAIVNVLKDEIAQSLVDAMENAIINGDTTVGDSNINGSTVGNDLTDQRRIFNGIRKITEDRNTAGIASKVDFGGTPNLDKFIAMRGLMGKEGVKYQDLVYVMSPSTYHKLLSPANMPELVTIDKYGNDASLVTGTVAKISGIPVVVSEFIPENLDENGKYADDGSKTIVLLVNKTMFATASRGTAKYESDRNIVNATNLFTGYRDVDFKELTEGLGTVSSVVGYNIDA